MVFHGYLLFPLLCNVIFHVFVRFDLHPLAVFASCRQLPRCQCSTPKVRQRELSPWAQFSLRCCLTQGAVMNLEVFHGVFPRKDTEIPLAPEPQRSSMAISPVCGLLNIIAQTCHGSHQENKLGWSVVSINFVAVLTSNRTFVRMPSRNVISPCKPMPSQWSAL